MYQRAEAQIKSANTECMTLCIISSVLHCNLQLFDCTLEYYEN